MVVTVIGLVVIVLGALGYIAWQNYSSGNNGTAPESTPVAQQPVDLMTDNDTSYEGKRIVSHDGAYGIKIPNGWEVFRITATGFESMIASSPRAESVAYNKDEAPKVSDIDGTPSHATFAVAIAETPREDTGDKTEFVLSDGTKGTKAVQDMKNGGTDPSSPQDWYYRTYTFVKNGKTVEMTWVQGYPAGTSVDPKIDTLLDDIARTIRIK